MTHAERMKPILVAAVEAAIKDGWTIKPEHTYEEHSKRCCPIGAFAKRPRGGNFDAVNEKFDLPFGWTGDFASGFDNCPDEIEHPDAFELGAWFRREYVEKSNGR